MKLGSALATVAAALVLALPADAAAPNYILVSGRGLAHPVLLADWQQNLKLMLAVANAPRADSRLVTDLRARPRFDLAEFWAWRTRPRPTSAAQASQHGVFYPSAGSRPALVVLEVQGIRVPRLAPPLLLRVLARHGVPTHA